MLRKLPRRLSQVGRVLAATVAAVGLSTAVQAQKTELTMYYPVAVGGPLTKVVDGLIEGFEQKNPDIDVSAIYAGNYNDARVKALAALKSGKPAQLSVMFSIDVHELMGQDAIVAFDDLVKTPEEKQWLSSFYPTLMQNGKVNGKTYGIPFQRSTIVMYYNKDAFRAAGLDPETPPKSWDELVAAGKKLTKRDASGKVSQWGAMIPSTGYPYWMFGALTKQNGEVLMSQDGTKTFFDKPGVVEALSFWKDLGSKHQIMPEGTVEWGTLRQNFLEGKTAMMWHSTGNLTAVKKNAKFDFGVAMLPAQKEFGSPTGGGNFYIFKKSSDAEKQAAMRLIKYMTAPEQAASWSKATGYMGVSEDAYKTASLYDYVQKFPAAAVARDQLKYATAELSTHQAGRVRKLLDDAIQAVLTGEKDAQAALSSAQSQADRILKRYR
ncbi:ABC transporter substrate-binding protein [Parendozoicomonas haliclonae]|uniref:sn-glycerol-3-phosphate-binding periplasmic protein UgpB n=1 Tax=Parendozoicomonas haliclonae TaxID=1960125 RepID=A0A1X7ARA0_9GAMM|nr:ABC transporter substrate-binding protein [Parendozoicomonas haliclonae]SMA50765.1 sn-glycerol-3-phosphate-binding periplasmic protein UgpB precursor [Parendozoicomonas haliclonae]